MPTGYTAPIKDGISFDKFVMNCARAFGALVTMRDEPDSEIPEKFEPSKYYDEQIEKSQIRLSWLNTLTDREATLQAQKEYSNALIKYRECLAELNKLKQKYLSMLAKVERWEPPSPDHVGLKKFMVSQIYDSIRADCSIEYLYPPVKMTGTEWLQEEKKKCSKDIEYYTKERKAEVDRVELRNEWLGKLRESLAINT